MPAVTNEFIPSLIPPELRAKLLETVGGSQDDPRGLWEELRSLARRAGSHEPDQEQLQLAVAASILADLAEHGWTIEAKSERLWVTAPDPLSAAGGSIDRAKAQIRAALHRVSDQQIASQAVQEFMRRLERERVFGGRTVSVLSLIDSGAELADAFGRTNHLGSDRAEERLRRIVDPIVVICDPDGVCQFTGIPLQDIWRYCRHTWSLEYNSLPGRTLRLLVRNRARPNWPVIGIAMLASPAANLFTRDTWIGWRLDDVVQRVLDGTWSARDVSRALVKVVKEAIGDIRTDDLLDEGEIERPSEATLFRLSQIAARATSGRLNELRAFGQVDGQIVDIRSIGKRDAGDEDWKRLSETSLFLRKRAEQLVPLLSAVRHFELAGFRCEPAAALYESLVTRTGRKVVSFALGELRRRRLASQVADLAVCGAIAPYNELIGGKLVALLAASNEVRTIYSSRYSSQASEIASQIAGRRVTRPTELKVLTTTSLYGVGSSQYNRLKLRKSRDWSVSHDFSWDQLSSSEGYTVTHVTRATVELMRELAIARYGARRINSVFGEGSSPRVRQIREGLNLIGINNDHVLKQHVGRRVYACELFSGAREDLIGFAPQARRAKGESAARFTRAWVKRWLVQRVANDAVLARLRELGPNSVSSDLRRRRDRASAERTAVGDREAPLAAGRQNGLDHEEELLGARVSVSEFSAEEFGDVS